MAKDLTNSPEPESGGRLGGETARFYAIRRLQKKQEQIGQQTAQVKPPEPPKIPRRM